MAQKQLTCTVVKATDQNKELRQCGSVKPMDSSRAPMKAMMWSCCLRNLASSRWGSRSHTSVQTSTNALWNLLSLGIDIVSSSLGVDCRRDSKVDHVSRGCSGSDMGQGWRQDVGKHG